MEIKEFAPIMKSQDFSLEWYIFDVKSLTVMLATLKEELIYFKGITTDALRPSLACSLRN